MWDEKRDLMCKDVDQKESYGFLHYKQYVCSSFHSSLSHQTKMKSLAMQDLFKQARIRVVFSTHSASAMCKFIFWKPSE